MDFDELNESTTNNERKTEYRHLLDQIENLNDTDSIIANPSFINDTLRRVNILFNGAKLREKVKHTDEVLLDAKVIATASDVLLKVTNQIDCALDTYDPADFTRRIRSKLINTGVDEDSDAYHENLIEATQHLFNRAPNFCTFYGPIGKLSAEPPPPPKERKTKTKTQEKQVQKKVPEKITHAAKEEDSVDDTVKFLQWSLTNEYERNNSKPISYYNFLLDPKCFSTSIENLFHVSFLIRDGRVKIESDLSGNLFLLPVSNTEVKRSKKGLVDYKQFMFTVDMKQWNAIIKDKKIKDYFLKSRKKEWEELKKKM